MSESLRTFVALELTQEIQSSLKSIQDDFKETGADIKWVKPQNIHLTLKFLGQTPVEKISSIADILRTITSSYQSFSIKISSVGTFPKTQKPKVLWAGISEGKEKISELAQTIENACEKLGFPREERDFKTHITIGRLRSNRNQFAFAKKIKEFSFDNPIIQDIETLAFIKSTLTPHGPIYENLHTFSLKKR